MGLFTKKNVCGKCCSQAAKEVAKQETENAVKILGGGCSKCNALEKATVEALSQLGLNTEVDHIKDYAEIASYGVMTTPALVFDGKVLSYGKVLTVNEVMELIKKEL